METGDTLIYVGGNSYHFFVHLFSAWSLGLRFIPLDPRLTQHEVSQVSDLVKPKLVWANDNYQIVTESKFADPGLVLFTSGSTGRPKGIQHSWVKVQKKIEMLKEHIPAEETQVSLCALPTSFGHGLVGNSLLPLLSGGELVVAPPFNPLLVKSLHEITEKYHVTFLSSVPSLWTLAKSLGVSPLSKSISRVHVASAPLRREQFEYLKIISPSASIYHVYGMTEFLSWISAARLDSFDPGNVGKGWGNLFENLNGEITTASDFIFDTIIGEQNPIPHASPESFYLTGDSGHLNEAGDLIITGRTKNQINKAGIKISPEEIELALTSFEYVLDAAVIGIEDTTIGERTIAFLVLRNQDQRGELAKRQITRDLVTLIASYKLPDQIIFIDSIPRNLRGKVDYKKLKEMSGDSNRR